MPVIKIEFFKVGVKGSTWIEDEYWRSLGNKEKDRIIEAFVNTRYQSEMKISKSRDIEPHDRHYNWGEM